ncbi:MAG TPA: tlde1 domain-containing protein [Devosiaceae bacterium]|nr:tlde1 domain-containing protein [Devosiaceae bacterium]
MALANTTWDSYPADGSSVRRARQRRNSFGKVIAVAILASGAFAAVPLWHAVENSFLVAPNGAPHALADGGTGDLSEASRSALQKSAETLLRESLLRSQFESNVESFLGDSLRLTGGCQADCALSNSEIAEAERVGKFGPAGAATAPTGFSPPPDVSLRQRFDSLVAGSFALLSRAPAPEIAANRTPPVPAPVRIAPSVVVPLPREIPGPAAAPVPSARRDRSAEDAMTFAAPGEPLPQSASGGRFPSPAPSQVFGRNDGVAIYDISAATVYMPNGQRLEAHSGLGYMVDNPRYVDRRNTGPTPPNTYNLVMRKGRFHGVDALRLIPADGDNKYGRVGLLAHTYLLRGRPAESNGCVAFKDYARFLEAFERGSVRRLIVVPSLSGSPVRMAST